MQYRRRTRPHRVRPAVAGNDQRLAVRADSEAAILLDVRCELSGLLGPQQRKIGKPISGELPVLSIRIYLVALEADRDGITVVFLRSQLLAIEIVDRRSIAHELFAVRSKDRKLRAGGLIPVLHDLPRGKVVDVDPVQRGTEREVDEMLAVGRGGHGDDLTKRFVHGPFDPSHRWQFVSVDSMRRSHEEAFGIRRESATGPPGSNPFGRWHLLHQHAIDDPPAPNARTCANHHVFAIGRKAGVPLGIGTNPVRHKVVLGKTKRRGEEKESGRKRADQTFRPGSAEKKGRHRTTTLSGFPRLCHTLLCSF